MKAKDTPGTSLWIGTNKWGITIERNWNKKREVRVSIEEYYDNINTEGG